MANTKKTLSQLMTDYADNTAGSITPQLLRNGFKTVVGSMVVSAISTNYTLVEDDIFVNVTPTTSDITITVPSASSFTEKYFIIKNSGSSFNVVVTGSIDSLSSYTILSGQVLGIESNGSTWISYIKSPDLSGFATSTSVSTLSADVQNKMYTSAAFTKTSADTLYPSTVEFNDLTSVVASISGSSGGAVTTDGITVSGNGTSANPIGLSSAQRQIIQNKLDTSAAFTKTSADTLYETLTDASNKAYTSAVNNSFNSLSATCQTIEDNINGLFGTKSYQNTSKKSCGIIIPAYFYPSGGYIDSNYTSLCDLARSYRDIPTIAAINPSNGPGTVVDGNFTAALEMMTGAGIVPIGYISTAYMGRDLSAVESDMLTWKTLYPQIRGIWVDEMVNFATSAYTIEQIVSYYNAIYIYAKQTLGLEYVFGNPGATYDIALWYGEVADNITYYENSGFPTETFMKQDGNFDGALIQVPTKAKSAVVYNISAYDNRASSSVAMMKKYCSFLYVTNDNLPNPYDTLSPYLSNIYRDLNVDIVLNARTINTSATPGSIQFDGYNFFITVND